MKVIASLFPKGIFQFVRAAQARTIQARTIQARTIQARTIQARTIQAYDLFDRAT